MKYIVDLPDNTHWIQWIMEGKNDHHPYMGWKDIEDLTPYTEPDRKAIEDEVWELTGKIQKMTGYEMYDVLDITAQNYDYFCNVISYQEAKAKYEAWKKQKDEIRLGYEVEYPPNKAKGIVVQCHVPDVYAEVDKYAVFTGASVEYLPKEWLTKTGRIFPEVAELLKKMKETDEIL